MRKDRKRRGASGMYKLEELFRGSAEGEELKVGENVHYVDGSINGHLFVSVPETTSMNAATALERELTKAAGKPVVVITHNIVFLRATKLDSKEAREVAELVKGATMPEDPMEGSADADAAE